MKDIVRIILRDGWVLVRQKGSHKQFKHPDKKGVVTIAGKDSMELHPKVLKSIFKQVKISEELIQ